MILVDANLLIYAANHAAVEHEPARTWLDDTLGGEARVGMPWFSLLAFVRVMTNPVLLRDAVSMSTAWNQVREWLSWDTVWIPEPMDRHAGLLESFFRRPGMSSRLVSDAHLAALAIEHGLTLCTTDGDFAKFPGLTWENPMGTAGRIFNPPSGGSHAARLGGAGAG